MKTKLLRGLADERLLPDGIDPEEPPATLTEGLTLAFHRFLGLTPALLKAIQLEMPSARRSRPIFLAPSTNTRIGAGRSAFLSKELRLKIGFRRC